MRGDYDYSVECDYNDLVTPGMLAKQAAERCIAQLGSRSVPSQKCAVVFEARIASSLLKHFFSAIRGGNLYRKSSWLVDSLGKQIFPKGYTIAQHPHLLGQTSSLPFDSDGVLTKDIHFVEDGQLQSYALGVYSARKLGLESTGNACGIMNLSLQPEQQNLQQLLQQLGTGLFVTGLIGQGVNITTGEYSRGSYGFLGRER